MTQDLWDKIETLSTNIERRFDQHGEKYSENETKYTWYNSLYRSLSFRRAHIEIVDFRKTYNIYILHSTIFPHYNDPSPIWGFDVICGPTKITGAFHDFSSGGDSTHFMCKWFNKKTKDLVWNKPRELPFWAKQIFSPAMIAVGNLQENSEIDKLCDITLETLDYYLANVGKTQESGSVFHMAQNKYCYYQKQNPHVMKSMISMNVPKETIQNFVHEILFPEIEINTEL